MWFYCPSNGLDGRERSGDWFRRRFNVFFVQLYCQAMVEILGDVCIYIVSVCFCFDRQSVRMDMLLVAGRLTLGWIDWCWLRRKLSYVSREVITSTSNASTFVLLCPKHNRVAAKKLIVFVFCILHICVLCIR